MNRNNMITQSQYAIKIGKPTSWVRDEIRKGNLQTVKVRKTTLIIQN